jgi:hypothetical protein
VQWVIPRGGELGVAFIAFIAGIDIAVAIVPGEFCPHVADDVSFAVAVHQVIGGFTWVEGEKTNLKSLARSDPMKYVAGFYIAGLEAWRGFEWYSGWLGAAR